MVKIWYQYDEGDVTPEVGDFVGIRGRLTCGRYDGWHLDYRLLNVISSERAAGRKKNSAHFRATRTRRLSWRRVYRSS